MKIGTINWATYSGLGILTKEFWDNGIINDILIPIHPNLPDHSSIFYPGKTTISPPNSNYDINILENYIKELDILFLFETHFYPETIPLAKKYKIPVVVMPMYEWSPFPMDADMFIVPSQIDYDYYKKMYPDHRIIFLPVPSNSNIKWKLKEKALTFMHNGGNGSFHDRNGTLALIQALPHIKSPIKLKLKAQKLNLPQINDPRVEVINKHIPFDELWEDVDVFLFVERFNGLSLPLQEAHASGCLIISGDRYPINTWLPNKPLVKPCGVETYNFQPGINFLAEKYDPKAIAKKIDEFYNTDITEYSLAGKAWSESNSWKYLKPRYLDLLTSICKK